MLTQENAAILNSDRLNLVQAIREMKKFLDEKEVLLSAPITKETTAIDHLNIEQFLANQNAVLRASTAFDKSVAYRL